MTASPAAIAVPAAASSGCHDSPVTSVEGANTRPPCSQASPQHRDVGRVVHGRQLLLAGQAAVVPAQPVGQRPPLQHRDHVPHPLRVFGVQLRHLQQVRRPALEDAAPGVVVEHGRVPEDVDHSTVSSRGRVESTSIRSGPISSVSM